MLQEVITYMIIGSAITLAILKTIKRFRKKKPKKTNFNKDNIRLDHNCSECAADCVLRDLPKKVIETRSEVCQKVEIKS
jgi:large-conductance mechanosensitive channel